MHIAYIYNYIYKMFKIYIHLCEAYKMCRPLSVYFRMCRPIYNFGLRKQDLNAGRNKQIMYHMRAET